MFGKKSGGEKAPGGRRTGVKSEWHDRISDRKSDKEARKAAQKIISGDVKPVKESW